MVLALAAVYQVISTGFRYFYVRVPSFQERAKCDTASSSFRHNVRLWEPVNSCAAA